jgi:hypothetical protein
MLSEITDELKSDKFSDGNPLDNIIKIAESVAKKVIPKMEKNKVDMGKILQSTQNLTSGLTDAEGKPVFNDKFNPLNMLTNMMQTKIDDSNRDQMMAQAMGSYGEMMKNLENMKKK